MALDSSSTGFTTWTDADVAEKTRFGQSKFERMAQNQIAFDNRLDQQDNPWSLGDDFRTHFARRLSQMGNYLTQGNMSSGGTFAEDEDDHLVTLASANGVASGEYLITQMRLEPGKVATEVEFRAKADAYVTTAPVAVGVVSTNSATPGARTAPTGFANAAIFITGATSGTWDAVTVDSSAERSRTASISGTNYTSWDRLRIVLDGTDAKFYVHDGSSWVLKATHSTSLTTLMGTLLYCGAWSWNATAAASHTVLSLDLMVMRANSNVFSA